MKSNWKEKLKSANARKWKHQNGGQMGHTSKVDYEIRLEEIVGFKQGGILKFLQ